MRFLSFYVEVKAFKLKCHLSCCVLLDEGLSSSSWAPWSWTNWKLHYCAKAVQRCYRIDEQSALSHCIFTETTANPANGSMKAFEWREQAILHQAKANIFDDLEKRYRDNKQTKLCKLPYISAGQARTAMMLCSTQSTSAPRGLGTQPICTKRTETAKKVEKGEIVPTRPMIRNRQVYFCWWVSCLLFLLWLVFNGVCFTNLGHIRMMPKEKQPTISVGFLCLQITDTCTRI